MLGELEGETDLGMADDVVEKFQMMGFLISFLNKIKLDHLQFS